MQLNKRLVFSGIFLFALWGVQTSALNAQNIGFIDGYEISGWSASEIAGGTTNINELSEWEAEFTYTVRLPGGGVSKRTADYTVTVPNDANITFDWIYTGNHRFFNAYEEFHVIVNGVIVETPLVETKSSGNFTRSGIDQTISVEAGDLLGFRIGGRNFDSNSGLDGKLTISNFRVEITELARELDLVITKNDANPDTFNFQWSSKNGTAYNLVSSTDLSIPVNEWSIWDNQSNILASGETTQIQGVASGGPARFFLVVEIPGL